MVSMTATENFRILSRFTEITVRASHRFYIAFENSICKDYVTEKYFLRMSQLLVPVVFERKIPEDLGLPSDSFIALDDFNSIRELGNYLNKLRYDDYSYSRYFAWTKTFAKPILYRSDALCNICMDIYNQSKMEIRNITQYYVENQCNNFK
ncbi:hypothetical protein ANCDUO_12674 [Ancylostoma duodenale]|uniref:Fucosyltransferase n=1 Tax=Ancylostoma duodenale TaxID=51022 RepID=A0A0C2D4U3_9BILA|nr:hypothetical protein ANCDUO_12674 [Ancylostoma duodenale]